MVAEIFHGLIGATETTGSEQVTIFIPNKDKDSNPIKQDEWVDQALKVLGTLFGGATTFPPAKGVWRNDEDGGKLIEETSQTIFSYTDMKKLKESMPELRKFLHRFGREANQGEVAVVLPDGLHRIRKYDQE